ncbi:hypothetical protein E2C01_068102 [Portunus trituberculatus]|uniref:Uncharacterized protein n=1 Tax=Portunus trituberculatus TaxID=210409 RepID=A0A5B7HVE4_PORTR|nr:hypothetical protein [Portunus trituberculatus]
MYVASNQLVGGAAKGGSRELRRAGGTYSLRECHANLPTHQPFSLTPPHNPPDLPSLTPDLTTKRHTVTPSLRMVN